MLNISILTFSYIINVYPIVNIKPFLEHNTLFYIIKFEVKGSNFKKREALNVKIFTKFINLNVYLNKKFSVDVVVISFYSYIGKFLINLSKFLNMAPYLEMFYFCSHKLLTMSVLAYFYVEVVYNGCCQTPVLVIFIYLEVNVLVCYSLLSSCTVTSKYNFIFYF